MDTLRLWLASGQGCFYFCFCLRFTEYLGTGHCTKHLPGAGTYFSTCFQKLVPGLLLHLTQTQNSAHQERSTALPAPAMPFWEVGSLQGFSWKPGVQGCNCASLLFDTSSVQSWRGKFKLQSIGDACMSMQKCSRTNPLELIFKPLFKALLPNFPYVNQSGNTASTKIRATRHICQQSFFQ